MKRFAIALFGCLPWVAAVAASSLGGCATNPDPQSDTSNETEICVPKCDGIGTSAEGWYDCQGGLVGARSCEGCTAVCDAIGSRSEGWYSTCDGTLIGWDHCSAVPTPTACEAAGGECVGLTPTNCTDGEWGDVDTYSCGGPIGVGCCLPPAPVENACVAAGGECVGVTPTNCTDGEWGDVDTYSCGGPIGVGCCLPPAPVENACEAAGGECVGVTPTNCTDGEWGDVDTYSCGGPIGVGCCLPSA